MTKLETAGPLAELRYCWLRGRASTRSIANRNLVANRESRCKSKPRRVKPTRNSVSATQLIAVAVANDTHNRIAKRRQLRWGYRKWRSRVNHVSEWTKPNTCVHKLGTKFFESIELV